MVSAAEKLKALEQDDSGWMTEGVLRNALPRIIAVVEAAEQLNDGNLIFAKEEEALEAALAALDEALAPPSDDLR